MRALNGEDCKEVRKMTDREAIEWFENELEDGKCSEDCIQCNANERALEALREREERQKGCEYCNDNFEFWATEISGYFDKKDVKFCIHCGRPLKGENNE